QNLPTDPAALRERLAEIHRRRLTLLGALLGTKLVRPLTPTEEAAISLAIHETTGHTHAASTLTDPTLPQVWAALRDPTAPPGPAPRFGPDQGCHRALQH
ncbi:hypothetical protein KGA66_26365, partial [Actinocrinis puniceicyclus]|nr:hypothetical protein [Actinocrinis puniceicyclus]